MASSSVLAANPTQHHMDRLDAARALLGVSPQAPDNDIGTGNSSSAKSAGSSPFLSSKLSNTSNSNRTYSPSVSASPPAAACNKNVSFEVQPPVVVAPQPAVSIPHLNGLDALAALASKEQLSLEQLEKQQGLHHIHQHHDDPIVSTSATSSDNDDEDSEAMPPPPPRAGGRRRSVSNPEGMEKWAPYNRSSRQHFVLPASILEEELAEASAAMEAHERQAATTAAAAAAANGASRSNGSLPFKKRGSSWGHEDDHSEGSGSDSVDHHPESSYSSNAPISGLMSADEQANLTPDELLKRARSRLLEDLSEGSINGEKGVLTLPHSLAKYKEVYNKNGRIGIYTPAERAAIIARFQSKRSRRVWNKKIRYNCRKNLADRRMRVKGRFVKRSTEQMAKAMQEEHEEDKPATGSEEEEQNETKDDADVDMPDVNDPDAGFCPTEDQPYRRTRRHTIT